MEYTLIKDRNTNIIYTFNNGWNTIGFSEPLTKQNFINFGIQNIEAITVEQWDILPFGDIEVLTFFSENNNYNLNCITKDSFEPIELFTNPKLRIWVDTTDKINVSMDVVAESQTKFLLSKDNRTTWQVFNGSSWETVNLSDIHEKGMDKVILENITQEQWKLWFNRHYIDVAIGIKSQNINNSPSVNSVAFNFPENEAPILSNFEINPSPINRTDVVLKAKINDLEGDLFKYRIYNPTSVEEFKPYSLKFSGTNSQVSILHSVQLSPTKEMTIEFDIKAETFANTWMPIIYKGTSKQYSVWINSNGRLYCSITTTDGTERVMYNANLSNPLELNKFYNISVVINLNLGYMKLYKNGELWDTFAVPNTTSIQIQNAPLLFGATPEVNASYSPFKGIIQNVRIWSKERTIDDINLYRNQLIKNTYDNLIGNWLLNDKSTNSIVKDYSINQSNGTISNTTWVESDNVYYDESKWSNWSEWINGDLGEYNVNHTFLYTDFKIGLNILALEVMDDRNKRFISPLKYIELINSNPILTILTHDNWGINGIIDDPNGDKIKYRVLINGEQKYPSTTGTYTELLDVPYNFSFAWDSSDLIIGSYNNEVKIEILDSFNSVTEYVISDIVGRYKNIMFKVDSTPNSKYYSDDKGQLLVWDGNILSYWDLGIIVAGQISESQPIYVTNLFGQPLENIKVFHSGVTGFDLDLSKDQSFANPQNEIQFDGIMNDGEQKVFYARVKTSPLASGNGGIFEIKANGDIV